MEYFDVYDRNGSRTGRTSSSRRTLVAGEYCLGINAYLCNTRQEFLIQRRAETKRVLPGIWDIHMGHAIAGETSRQALIREIREEIGVVLPDAQIGSPRRFFWREENYILDVYFIVADIAIDSCVLQKEEVEEVRYIGYDQMVHLIRSTHRPGDYQALACHGVAMLVGR